MAVVVVVAAALAVSMMAVLASVRNDVTRGRSLLAREHLRFMVEEAFTRDLLALRHDASGVTVSTDTLTFTWGNAESHVAPVPTSVTGLSGMYVVVVATLTSTAADPRHVQLETVLDWTPPAPPPPTTGAAPRKSLADDIEAQLRTWLADDQAVRTAKDQILSQLTEVFGPDLSSLAVAIEMNEYRDAAPPAGPHAADTFYLTPVSVSGPDTGPKIRVWKETYQ